MPWSDKELANLIRGIFRFGENEWSDLMDDVEVHPSRTPNDLALKWRKVKQLMNTDIKRIIKESNFEKIITKHEWMVAALELLEKDS